MPDSTFTCPRCFLTAPVHSAIRFCPRCGLPDPITAAQDTSPLEVSVKGRTFRVLDRIAIGSVCNIYRCTIPIDSGHAEGIFKIARDPRSNDLVANEAAVLRRLRLGDTDGRFAAFLPSIEESFCFADLPGACPRQANILRMHPEIRSPADALYSLAEVRDLIPQGLDPRDMAWIWRRLLSVLGFLHTQDVVHAAILPMHVLIEPRDHKLVLIDWCCAVAHANHALAAPNIIAGGYDRWYKSHGAWRRPPKPAMDVGFAARCMIELCGGDPTRGQWPATIDIALQRYFSRCLAPTAVPDAWRLLDDFDRLIEALWGPRRFRPLALPPKRRA